MLQCAPWLCQFLCIPNFKITKFQNQTTLEMSSVIRWPKHVLYIICYNIVPYNSFNYNTLPFIYLCSLLTFPLSIYIIFCNTGTMTFTSQLCILWHTVFYKCIQMPMTILRNETKHICSCWECHRTMMRHNFKIKWIKTIVLCNN